LEGSGGIWNRIRQKPFALWVIFGGFVYFGLVILSLAVPTLAASPGSIGDPIVASILVFMALFFVSAFLSLKGKRWTSVLAAVVSILFLVLFGSFLVPSLVNPADAAFSLAISGIPALILVAIFSILSIIHAKSGLLQKRYLATPNSSGGLLTIGVIGFVVGGLVVGAIGGSVILRNIAAGTADVTIVRDAASAAIPYVPGTFQIAVGGTVTWINKDTTAHTVTSSPNGTSRFDSGALTTGATWSHTFTQPGTYWYYCTIHPMMIGRIIVS
jgi:plastocyanin